MAASSNAETPPKAEPSNSWASNMVGKLQSVALGDPLDPAEGKPLLILTPMPAEKGEACAQIKVENANLREVSDNLKRNGAEVVSIIAVMGMYRSGKSFLLDLVLRYMKARMKGPVPKHDYSKWKCYVDDESTFSLPEWLLTEGDPEKLSEGYVEADGESDAAAGGGFGWRPGQDKCTEGVWMWSVPFVFPDEQGRKVGVVLMDTQGAWDGALTSAQSGAIFGLTALLSSKLIFNIRDQISMDQIDHIDYITTLVSNVCADCKSKKTADNHPFGTLQMMIRDFCNFDEDASVDACMATMDDHMQHFFDTDRLPEENRPKVQRVKDLFKKVTCHCLRSPGERVQKKRYDGTIKDIELDFIVLLDAFMNKFFNDEFPRASAPRGIDIKVKEFEDIVTTFAKAFREKAEDMTMDLRDAFVFREIVNEQEDAVENFEKDLHWNAPSLKVYKAEQLHELLENLQTKHLDMFAAELTKMSLSQATVDKAREKLKEPLEHICLQREADNANELKMARMKLIASPVVGFVAYNAWYHYIIAGGAAVAFTGYKAKKTATTEGIKGFGPGHMVTSAKDGVLQGIRDTQSIFIALQQCSPDDSMGTLMDVQKMAGTAMAVSKVAAASK